MLDYLIKRPLLLCGICACIVSFTAFYSRTAVFIIAVLLSVSLGFMIYFKADARIIFTSVLIFVLCISCVLSFNKIDLLKAYSGTTQRLKLTVTDITHKTDEYFVAEASVNKSDNLPVGTKITVFYEPENIRIGQRLIADVKIKEQADGHYKKDGYSKGIYLRGNMSNITRLSGEEDLLLTAAEKVRGYIRSALKSNMEYESAATLCALIFGSRDYFTDEFYENVKSAGVSHVMVVSGMHMAILVSFFVMLLEKLFYNRFAKALIIVLIVLFLAVICGFTMSILRTGVTYLIMAGGILLGRKGTPENTLGGAITFILILSPYAIFSVALQLSLLSTFGILVVAIPVMRRINRSKRINRILSGVINSVILSLSAMLFTLPVTVIVFGYVSTVAVISNLLISMAVSAALYVAVTALVLNLVFPFIAELLFTVAGLIVKYINGVINFMGSLSFATAELSEIWLYIAVFMILLVITLLLACKKRLDMLKLKTANEKRIKEGGGKFKWHL